MKKILLLIFIIAISFSNVFSQGDPMDDMNKMSMPDPLIDEIIQKNINARGGLAELSKVNTWIIESEMLNEMSNTTSKSTMVFKGDNKYKVTLTEAGVDQIFAFDGKMAWIVSAMYGATEPMQMPDGMIEMMNQQFQRQKEVFVGIFNNYKAQRLPLKYDGKLKKNEKEYYVIKIEGDQPNTGSAKFYFDINTYQINYIEMDSPNGLVTIYLDDYRKVGNIFLPFVFNTSMTNKGIHQGVTKVTFKEYKLNTEIDDTVFAMPTSPVPKTTPNKN